MTADFLDNMFLGLLTYFVHSTVFLGLGLLITSLPFLKNLGLKELILKFALFGALITAPLQLSGAFESLVTPIQLPEQTLKSEPAPLTSSRPAVTEVLPATDPVTTKPAAQKSANAGSLKIEPRPLSDDKTGRLMLNPANLVLIVWALVASVFLVRLGFLIRNLKAQLRGRTVLKSGPAVKLAQTLSLKAGIKPPRISIKTDLAGPFCLGSGEILLPQWANQLPQNQLRALIAHEIAHIKRADPYWILAIRVVQSVFFFQPLNVLAARKLSEISEFSCDAWAGRVCGSGMPLAECLAECAKRHLGRAPSALGSAMATRRSPIVERTQRLLTGFREQAGPVSAFSRITVLVAFLIGGSMIPVFAFDENPEQALREAEKKLEDAEQEMEESKRALQAEKARLAAQAESLPEPETPEIPEIPELPQTAAIQAELEMHGAMDETGSTSSFIHIGSSGEMDIKISYQGEDSTMKIRGEGKFRFNDAETAMAEMSDESYLDIRETKNGTTRRVRFEGTNGGFSESHWLDGGEIEKDAAAARWLAEVIPAMYRQTGIDAKGRTRRIFKASGVEGVLEEAGFINSSYAKRVYLSTLADLTQLSDSESERFMELAGNIPGSYDLRETLIAFVKTQRLSSNEWRAFARTAGKISGSYDLRETLSAAAENFSGPSESWLVLLDTAGKISGPYDLRETLTGFRAIMPKDDAVIGKLAEVSERISSSYDRRETLTAYAEEGGYGEQGWLALLNSAAGISSSYDKRSTLEAFAENMPRSGTLVERYREIARNISSEHDREEALEALAE